MTKAPLALLLVVLIGLCMPLLAAVPCEEGGSADCDVDVDVDCPLCSCCSHGPQVAASTVGRGLAGQVSDQVGILAGGLPAPPVPWDILHVPKPGSQTHR